MNMGTSTLKSTGKYRTQLMRTAELENLNSKNSGTSADKVATIPKKTRSQASASKGTVTSALGKENPNLETHKYVKKATITDTMSSS
jgi:hypothetical protein